MLALQPNAKKSLTLFKTWRNTFAALLADEPAPNESAAGTVDPLDPDAPALDAPALSDPQRAELRAVCQQAAIDKVVTPAAVFAYAKLHLLTDEGLPVTPTPFHRLWVELLCDLSIPRLLILSPPESAKTTWVISAYAGLNIGVFPQRPIIVGSATGGVAGDRVLSLRTMTESDEWRLTFPNVRQARGMTWETYKWSVAPGGVPYPGRIHPTVAAYGPDGGITGARAFLSIGDDIVDDKNSRTAKQRKIVSNWAHKTFIPRVKSRGGLIRLIGTAWHPNDVYSELKESGDFVVCRTPLLSESNLVYAEITYPDGWAGPIIGQRLGQAEV